MVTRVITETGTYGLGDKAGLRHRKKGGGLAARSG